MTSMPASRSAAAITLAPRSWPSSPALPSRILGVYPVTCIAPLPSRSSELRGWLVGAEDLPQRTRDLTDRGVGEHRLADGRHEVVASPRRAGQPLERAPNLRTVALGTHALERAHLRLVRFFRKRLGLDRRLLLARILGPIDADHGDRPVVHAPLVFVGPARDLALDPAGAERLDHAPPLLDAVHHRTDGLLHGVRERLHEVRTAERIRHLRHLRFEG